jgi:hypothetical protein
MKNDRIKNDRIKNNRIKSDRIKSITDPFVSTLSAIFTLV